MSEALDLDIESLASPTSDDYYTPRFIFESLGIQFDLDVSAPVGGISWIPATKHYSIEDDGLLSPWYGKVWMNPPYSKPSPWIDKFIKHNNGICLVPAAKSQWFHDIWDSEAQAALLPVHFKFVRGNAFASIMFQTVLFAMGDECIDALRSSNLGRLR